MIFCFSGTGNSLYIANRLSAALSDPVICINDRIRSRDYSAVEVPDRLIFVCPTHCYRIPRVVEDWIRRTPFSGAKDAWFLMSCGSSVGGAGLFNEQLSLDKGFRYRGTCAVEMPENYVALFPVPADDEALSIIRRANPVIDSAAALIGSGSSFPDSSCSPLQRFLSDGVNRFFYRFIVRSGPFRVTGSCNGCGSCAQHCPVNNIRLEDGKPLFGPDCIHCMKCICSCPQQAIEYGKRTEGKHRYRIEKLLPELR